MPVTDATLPRNAIDIFLYIISLLTTSASYDHTVFLAFSGATTCKRSLQSFCGARVHFLRFEFFHLTTRNAMSRSGQPPDLKKYMDKQLNIKLNANRIVVGTLRGFDQFMNLVVDETVEINGDEKNDIGMVVIRGNSVVMIEALEPVNKP